MARVRIVRFNCGWGPRALGNLDNLCLRFAQCVYAYVQQFWSRKVEFNWGFLIFSLAGEVNFVESWISFRQRQMATVRIVRFNFGWGSRVVTNLDNLYLKVSWCRYACMQRFWLGKVEFNWVFSIFSTAGEVNFVESWISFWQLRNVRLRIIHFNFGWVQNNRKPR